MYVTSQVINNISVYTNCSHEIGTNPHLYRNTGLNIYKIVARFVFA
jgi:hypothetical protein